VVRFPTSLREFAGGQVSQITRSMLSEAKKELQLQQARDGGFRSSPAKSKAASIKCCATR